MRVWPIRIATYTLGLWITFQSAAAQELLTGRVIGIADGDTLTVLTGGARQVVVRLAAIDAPEIGKGKGKSGQPFGTRSRQALSDLCFAQQAHVELIDGQNTHGRLVGFVRCAGTDANREMLRNGMAWVYPQFNRGPRRHDYVEAQAQARSASVGLWASEDAEEPWLWRKKSRAN